MQSDPSLASVCSFFQKFGESLGFPAVSFSNIRNSLENCKIASDSLLELMLYLLRRIDKVYGLDFDPVEWEKAVVTFCKMYSPVDAFEIDQCGFVRARPSTKARVLKNLLECQFDCNEKFKDSIDEIPVDNLRSSPVGRDKDGYSYWYLLDNQSNHLLYREEQDDNSEGSFQLVSSCKDSLSHFIKKLQDGDTSLESPTNLISFDKTLYSSEEDEPKTSPKPGLTAPHETSDTPSKDTPCDTNEIGQSVQKGISEPNEGSFICVTNELNGAHVKKNESEVKKNDTHDTEPKADSDKSNNCEVKEVSDETTKDKKPLDDLDQTDAEVKSSEATNEATEDKSNKSPTVTPIKSNARGRPKKKAVVRAAPTRVSSRLKEKEEREQKKILERITKDRNRRRDEIKRKALMVKRRRHPSQFSKSSSGSDDDYSSSSDIDIAEEDMGDEYHPTGRNAIRLLQRNRVLADQASISNGNHKTVEPLKTATENTGSIQASTDDAKENDQSESDFQPDKPCTKCGSLDQPEAILWCDKCAAAVHTACLRPPLMAIPDGDWCCPTCEHNMLVENLKDLLKQQEEGSASGKRTAIKERLAMIALNIDNFIADSGSDEDKRSSISPRNTVTKRTTTPRARQSRITRRQVTPSPPPAPLCVTRTRRTRKQVQYTFDDFDEAIDSAIADEKEKKREYKRQLKEENLKLNPDGTATIPPPSARGPNGGKDISNILEEEDGPPPPVGCRRRKRNASQSSSSDSQAGKEDSGEDNEDDGDEEYKISSASEEEEEAAAVEESEEESNYSDDASDASDRLATRCARHEIEPEIQFDDETGRPRRRAARKAISYLEAGIASGNDSYHSSDEELHSDLKAIKGNSTFTGPEWRIRKKKVSPGRKKTGKSVDEAANLRRKTRSSSGADPEWNLRNGSHRIAGLRDNVTSSDEQTDSDWSGEAQPKRRKRSFGRISQRRAKSSKAKKSAGGKKTKRPPAKKRRRRRNSSSEDSDEWRSAQRDARMLSNSTAASSDRTTRRQRPVVSYKDDDDEQSNSLSDETQTETRPKQKRILESDDDQDPEERPELEMLVNEESN